MRFETLFQQVYNFSCRVFFSHYVLFNCILNEAFSNLVELFQPIKVLEKYDSIPLMMC